MIVRSSGGAHIRGTDDAAPAAEDNTLAGKSQEDTAEAEVDQPAAPEEVASEALPDTQDTAPLAAPTALAAPTPAGAPLKKDLDAEPVAQRLAADIPEVPIETSAISRQPLSSGVTEVVRLFAAAEIDGPAPDTAAQRLATTFATLETPEETASDPIASVTACACKLINPVLGVFLQIGTAFGTALGPVLLPAGPETPADSPGMWALLGWVRRQTDQILAIPAVADVVQTTTSIVQQAYQQIITCGQPSTALPAELERTTIVSGLDEPTDFRFLPDGRIIIIEKAGAIKIYPNSDQNFDPVTLVVLPTLILSEQGLTGIELDPEYSSNGYIYVAYTAAEDGRDRLSRLTVVGDTIDPQSEVVLMRSDLAAGPAHHGGELHFGPDGMLYWATGDNSNNLNAQNLSNIHGKILRLDPDKYDPQNPDATAPADNPFAVNTPDDAIPDDAIPQIWAYGLRNPFRFTFTPDGQLLVADVGNAAWEELNIVTKGGNYGWPGAEGVCEGAGCEEFVNPVYSYPHTPDQASAGSITSVLVYTGDTFPESYQNKVFIADYTLGWIKELTFDSEFSSVISERTLDSQAGTTVKLVQGPDGNIYQMTIYPGELSRIAPSDGNRAPTAVLTATPSNGLAPLVVDFSSQGSSDPDPLTTLTYAWDFGDGTTSTQANPSRTYTTNGTYNVTLTVSDGEETDQATTTITVGSIAPTATILTPVNNAPYSAGDTISFTADVGDGSLPDDAYKWTVVFHHADHVHPFQDNIVGPSGSVVIPRDPHNVATTFYRLTLTVTDPSSGLSTTSQPVDVRPRLVTTTYNANHPEATFTIDGIPHTGSYSEQAVVGVQRVLGAPSPQDVSDGQLVFNNWSDGGAQSHTIITPDANASYTVTYDFVAVPENVNL